MKAAVTIVKWYKGILKLRAFRASMSKRKRAVEDLFRTIETFRAAAAAEGTFAELALEIGGRMETSERHRMFVKQLLSSIPSIRPIRQIRPSRLRSVVVFVSGIALGDETVSALSSSRISPPPDVIRSARWMKRALRYLCDANSPKLSLRIVKSRLSGFNQRRLAFVKSFHRWRKDDIDALLRDAAPLYCELLLLRSADKAGASRRMTEMLGKISSVVGRKEARRWDLVQRRAAASRLADLLGESPPGEEEEEREKKVTRSQVRSPSDIVVGSRVVLHKLGRGIVRFLGKTEFGSGIWTGIQLYYPVGRNDGSVRGKSYFTCPDGHGIFVRPSTLVILSLDAATTSRGAAKTAATATTATTAPLVATDDGITDTVVVEDGSMNPIADERIDAKSSFADRSPVREAVERTAVATKASADKSDRASGAAIYTMSSGFTSSGGGGATSCSDYGGSDGVASSRRHRQNLARSLAKSIASRYKTQSEKLVHEVIMDPNFKLAAPNASTDSSTVEGFRRLELQIRDGQLIPCLGPVLEITEALFAIGGGNRRRGLVGDEIDALRAVAKDIQSKVSAAASSPSDGWSSALVALICWFVRVARVLLKVQSPAYDTSTREWMRTWEAKEEGFCSSRSYDELAPLLVGGFSWIATRIATIRVESTNFVIRAKLLPLLEGRGGVDYERRQVAARVNAGSISFAPGGASDVHRWLIDSTHRWCAQKSLKGKNLEKRRLRMLLLQNAEALERCAMSALLDLLLPSNVVPVPTFYRTLPSTLAMDRSRVALIRNKLHGLCVKAALVSVVEQVATAERKASSRPDTVLRSTVDSDLLPRVCKRFEGLLLAKETTAQDFVSQIVMEVRFSLLPSAATTTMSSDTDETAALLRRIKDAPPLSEGANDRIRVLVQQVFDPTKPLLQLVSGRLRAVLDEYICNGSDAAIVDPTRAGERDAAFGAVLRKTRLECVRSDIEALARPVASIASSMRSGRATSAAMAEIEHQQSLPRQGLIRRLFSHHWAVYSPHYTQLLVAAAQERAKDLV